MRQQTLADSSFEKFRKKTGKEQFLDEMEQVIAWTDLTEAIEPYYPKPDGAGRRAIGIERMLRIHFLPDPGAEEALYDSRALRGFVGIDLGREPVPDETTICKFRHLLEKYNLGDELFQIVNIYLEENGMKAHVGVDSRTKMIHSVVATAGNVHDSQVLQDLLHGDETRVWGDSAYAGQGAVIREHAPNAKDFTNQKGLRNRALTDEDAARDRTKSKVRAKVEHPFLILKRVFGFNKVRYRGLDKNATGLFVACALVNLYMARRQLLKPT